VVTVSQISRLVDELHVDEEEEARPLGRGDELEVPWQVCTTAGPELTVHYFTNAFHEVVGVRAAEAGDDVCVTVVERRTSDRLPGARRKQTLTLAEPLAGRRLVDGATGRVRAVFSPDVDAAWAAFDVAAAEWLLARDRLRVLRVAAHDALEDGCRSPALERIAAGERVLSDLYRERGLVLPDARAAAKLAVDAAIDPLTGEEPGAEAITLTLDAVAGSGRMDGDQREQIRGLLALGREIEAAFNATGEAGEEMDRVLDAARELRASGGLRP